MQSKYPSRVCPWRRRKPRSVEIMAERFVPEKTEASIRTLPFRLLLLLLLLLLSFDTSMTAAAADDDEEVVLSFMNSALER